MKLVHNITITVFVKPEEDKEEIKKRLIELIPFDLAEQKIKIEEQTAQGFNERKIKIYTVHLKKTTHTKQFLKNFLNLLNEEQKKLLIAQKESRLDEECNFFIRIEKEALAEKQKIQLTEGGNCYHIRLSVAAFPKTRENALKIVDNLFS
ncbi:hypothetical protein COV18_01350 [Candidatus Woesearchaeota archaeon CG10_big_fil_rev_8_21_14_0_10_37_12]|nr:MAG: hypothetical protein COV18_01350 [Candidatus Woesearchaeota archaeon CG10_big_fil_rev_8_21_14_0_10_37_12]